MEISSAVQWWDEWQLSVLVLSSLGVKCFLAVSASARRSYIGPTYRFAIWLSYLGGDALAIYALAALLNIQKKVNSSGLDTRGSHVLQVLWAPVMLMHLGGLAGISAYNIEDNDLWKRHIATSMSQVVVAVYVFCKLWSPSADKRLLAAAILLFIPGIFKSFEKPLALRRSSFRSLVSTQSPTSSSKDAKNENETQEPADLEQYIKGARGFFDVQDSQKKDSDVILKELSRLDLLFVDLSYPYSERLETLKSFWTLDDKQLAYAAIDAGISNTFNLLYTKDFTMARKYRDENVVDNLLSLCTWLFCLLVPIPAIGLLHSSNKEAYRGSDVKITFLLLYFTLFADVWSIGTLQDQEVPNKWHGMISQHNLLAQFARNNRHAWLTSIARLLRCTDLLELYIGMQPCNSSKNITDLVRKHVKDGWTNADYKINNAEDYWKFSDLRGERTLESKECERLIGREKCERLTSNLNIPFDEAVLIWHVATGFCFCQASPGFDENLTTSARQISNYMMHLLFANPEMLMPGSRTNLCTDAYNEIEDAYNKIKAIPKNNEEPSQKKKNNEEPLVEEYVAKLLFQHEGLEKGFICRAQHLAEGLMGISNEQTRWEVIKGVWIEMLCFSASRCRGYLHARSLGSGGEYLSFVWLLMAYAGMETFPERQQRPSSQQRASQSETGGVLQVVIN